MGTAGRADRRVHRVPRRAVDARRGEIQGGLLFRADLAGRAQAGPEATPPATDRRVQRGGLPPGAPRPPVLRPPPPQRPGGGLPPTPPARARRRRPPGAAPMPPLTPPPRPKGAPP